MTKQSKQVLGCLIAVAGLVALSTPTLRSQASAPDQRAESFQRSFAVSAGGTLQIDNYKGTIHVTGSDSNQVVVDVTKRFEGSEADRKWWMEHVEVNFRNEPNRVSVEVKYPERNCMFCWEDHDYSAAVELEIRVPRQINVNLESYKPDIRVSAIQGDIKIKSYKSPIAIDSTTGSIRVDTYKETVRLRDVTLRGPLEVKSYKADAEISAKALGQSVSLENYKGTIVLQAPQDAGFDVDYEGGRRASFHSDFSLNMQAGHTDHAVRATVNQGGTRLRLRSERGSVSLVKLSGGI